MTERLILQISRLLNALFYSFCVSKTPYFTNFLPSKTPYFTVFVSFPIAFQLIIDPFGSLEVVVARA